MGSTTRSRSKVKERREDVTNRVVRAVEEMMADGTPYTELPVQRIAERAQVARSTFYLHFPDKSRLLMAIADQAVDDLFAEAFTWWRADHSDGPPGVAHAMRKTINAYREHRRTLHALAEVAAYDSEVGDYWRARMRSFIEVVHHRLDTEQRAGRIDPAMHTPTTAPLLTWMVERTVSAHCHHDEGPGDAQIAASLARAIWLTIYGTAPATPPPGSQPKIQS